MFGTFLILFRETLEAALVVGIVLTYLTRVGRADQRTLVYLGVASGVGASLVGAIAFQRLAGGFSGRPEEVFEGVVMIAGAALLTTMVLWMMRQGSHAERIKESLDQTLSSGRRAGVFLLVFFSVLREGVETVVFLASLRASSGTSAYVGATLGFLGAVALGAGFFLAGRRLRLRVFFLVTNVLLVLFAAGLLAHGIHELQEAGVVPAVVEHLWDLNPAPFADGTLPALHENGAIGGMLKGLFGYNGNPALIEVLAYAFYLIGAVVAWRSIRRSPAHPSAT